MPNSTDAVRRWCGLVFLGGAFVMLVLGQTLFRERLRGADFLIYWSICFFLTSAAIIVALLDMRVTKRRAKQEHDELVRKALGHVEAEKPPETGEKPDPKR